MLDELIKQFPNNFVFYAWASSLFEMQHKLADGIQYLESLAERQAEASPVMAKHALLKKASLEHRAGRDISARQTLSKIQEMPGNDPFAPSEFDVLQRTIRPRGR